MKKIFVGNLSFSTTEAELRQWFEPHGSVESATVVTDRDTGRSRGFAFVEMPNDGEADAAIAALNGSDAGGRALTVNEARPKAERGGGSAAAAVAITGDNRVNPGSPAGRSIPLAYGDVRERSLYSERYVCTIRWHLDN